MPYQNPLMVELMVPRDKEISRRIDGFYSDIGWGVRNDTESELFTYVNPTLSGGETPPTIAYWQTNNIGKLALFGINDTELPSHYAKGVRFPALYELVDICLVVSDEEEVWQIFEQGGDLLGRHAHIPPRTHAGAEEFRFSDPFNYSLRVTANPRWEIMSGNQEIEFLLEPLEEFERQIIKWRFGLYHGSEPLSLETVGEKLEMSKMQVRQIEARAMRKIKNAPRLRLLKPSSEDS